MPKLSFLDQLDQRQIEYADKIAVKAKEMGVSPTLAVAIAYHESRLNPDVARGKRGEYGIMQIMPATGKSMGFTNKDLNDPEKNIEAGLKYLKQNLDAFGGDPKMATVGYNAGTNSPFFSGGELPQITENYVKAMKGYGAYDEDAAVESTVAGTETDEQRDARIQATIQSAMDEQEKRQAQLVGAGAGAGVAGTKLVGAGAGAVLQGAANRVGQGFSAGMQTNVPPVPPFGQPPAGPTSGEKWAAKTGYGKGAGTVQDVSSRFQRSIGQGPVSGRMDKLWGPALEGENPQLAQRLIDRAKAAEAAKIPPKVSGLDWITGKFADMFRPVSSAVSTVAKYGLPPIALASAAGEGVNIAQQYRKPEDQRDTTSMMLSGANILGSLGSLFPATMPVGIPLAIGSGAAQAYRDSPDAQAYVRKKIQGLADVPLLDEMTGPLP
jgi:hypothetical protein